MQLVYGLNVAFPYSLGTNVSNPTSGGNLVSFEQLLGVSQQQASATLMWQRKAGMPQRRSRSRDATIH